MKLGNLCDVVRGSSPRPKEDPRFYGGNVPRLMVADLTRDGKLVTPRIDSLTEEGAKQSRPMKKGDVVIAVSGNPGLSAILESDACIHDGFVGLRDLNKKQISTDYLYSYLMFFKNQINSQAVGAIYKNLTTEQIRNIEIPLPPLDEQKRIAAVLDKADALREKRRAAITKLDQLLQSVFLDMFGDPVSNPKGWETAKIGEIAPFISSGSTPLGGSTTYLSEGILFIRSQNVLMNSFDFSDAAFISDETHSKMKRTWVKNGDVLFNITGASIGRVHHFIGKDDSANVNQHVSIIRPNRNRVRPEFLSRFLSMPSYQRKIMIGNAGATRQAFNFEQIRNFPFLVPPIEKQNIFIEINEKITNTRKNLVESENENCNLFQSLQQRAFAGELFGAVNDSAMEEIAKSSVS